MTIQRVIKQDLGINKYFGAIAHSAEPSITPPLFLKLLRVYRQRPPYHTYHLKEHRK